MSCLPSPKGRIVDIHWPEGSFCYLPRTFIAKWHDEESESEDWWSHLIKTLWLGFVQLIFHHEPFCLSLVLILIVLYHFLGRTNWLNPSMDKHLLIVYECQASKYQFNPRSVHLRPCGSLGRAPGQTALRSCLQCGRRVPRSQSSGATRGGSGFWQTEQVSPACSASKCPLPVPWYRGQKWVLFDYSCSLCWRCSQPGGQGQVGGPVPNSCPDFTKGSLSRRGQTVVVPSLWPQDLQVGLGSEGILLNLAKAQKRAESEEWRLTSLPLNGLGRGLPS